MRRIGFWLSVLAVAAAVAALLLMPLVSLGRITGLLDWRMALRGFGFALNAAALTVVLGLLAFVVNRLSPWRSFRLAGAAAAFSAGIVVLVPMTATAMRALHAPPIHDITTDTADPPQFSTLLAVRTAAHAINPTDYSQLTATLQHVYYPDIKPAVLKLPEAAAFARVLALVKARGWRLAAADPEQGHIEATATTFWIGFSDDVAFRLTAQGAQATRVDMRSESRVGRSDIGTNAARVRAFLAALTAEPAPTS